MSYRCPLCLMELTEREQLARACTEHPAATSGPFNCTEENLGSEVFCPRGESCNGTIDSGVFLRHVGCEAQNPFWNGTTVNIPDRDNVTDYQYIPTGVNLKVNHWEIGMLRNVPPAREMWFPSMLLRATSDLNLNGGGKRIGVTVGLAGTQKVGKSVLAMLAMDTKGYVRPSDKSRSVEVRGYLFSRLPAGRTASLNPFLGNLYNHSLMSMNQDGLLPLLQTPVEPGDLKAAFIAPSKSSEARAAAREARRERRGLWGRFTGGLSEVARGTWQLFFRPKHHSFWYTVLFYDASGEAFVFGSRIPDQIERVADKIAVVIDATEIFGIRTDPSVASSIAGASERISKLRDKGLNCCLVVTKVDLIWDRLGPDEQKRLERVAEDPASDEHEAREVLAGWLTDPARAGDNRIDQLLRRLNLVDRVFFVWTEDLPPEVSDGAAAPHAKQPHSTGLAKLVCWCLDIGWDDINQTR